MNVGKIKYIFVIFIFFSLFFITPQAKAYGDLDEILDYEIIVNPDDAGNLNLTYNIKWLVLDSSTEGPLEWVKIGVPNKHVKNIVKNSDTIKKASYYSDNGSYIKIVFDRKYYKDEVVEFSFSFYQSRIFTLNNEYVEYQFKPGWFNEINVDHIKVLWQKQNQVSTNTNAYNDDYYIWEDYNLGHGETISVENRYYKNNFVNLDEKNTYISYEEETGRLAKIIFICILALSIGLIALVGFIYNRHQDGYEQSRGFTGQYHSWWWYYFPHRTYYGVNKKGDKLIPSPKIVSSGGGYSGGHSCACACACAGGGRAGCSRKDFNHSNISIDKIKENIK